ncbi:MAG TPA: hypothetical protein ENI97_07690 [Gammaproteobacteria bacterium]|nr:hypothetical protein [Gammaproteobacteria bacterium]
MLTKSSSGRWVISALASISLLILAACGGGGGGGGDTGGAGGNPGVLGLSQHGSTNSHSDSRRGSDCMDCHTSGPGTGVFITAGTSISGTGGYVEYYADTARTDLRARLEVDAYGNFYTVTAIDILTPNGSGFSQGAYVSVVMPNGSRRNMPGIVSHTSAGCNACHSSTGTQSPL